VNKLEVKVRRFFAYAQNDTIGLFFIILRPKTEQSHVLLLFEGKRRQKEILRRLQNDDVDFLQAAFQRILIYLF
jgi:hypothetical protein